jgi:hypothetical protein
MTGADRGAFDAVRIGQHRQHRRHAGLDGFAGPAGLLHDEGVQGRTGAQLFVVHQPL